MPPGKFLKHSANGPKATKAFDNRMAHEQLRDDIAHISSPGAELALPCLTEDMVRRMRDYGTEISISKDSILYTPGEKEVDMFVILRGSIEIYAFDESGHQTVIVHLGQRQFTGELDLLNSHCTLVQARTSEESDLIRVPRPQLRRLMRSEGDIANLLMQAMIWRRQRLLANDRLAMTVLSTVGSAETIQLQRFLTQNGYPHRMQEVTVEEVARLRGTAPGRVQQDILPAVILCDGRILHCPSTEELADELGITQLPDAQSTYDVTIVGAGPSGLAAAVFAASEGLSTLIIEGNAPGGQAGASSRIENYLGFPSGVSGQELARCAQMQAQKFGARLALSREAIRIEPVDQLLKITLKGEHPVCSRTVVIATGAKYRKLALPNYVQYENQGIYYAATAMEAVFCRNAEVAVVGGGNSAGQAATFLSGVASRVHLIIRGGSLSNTMSEYLISRIYSSDRITIHRHSEITELAGAAMLDSVSWVNTLTGVKETRPIQYMFVMIGADPNTSWLYGTLLLDKKGFIITGARDAFELSRYATTLQGVFAIGDVRSHSVKRVASAVGEGSTVISDVHRYLGENRHDGPRRQETSIAVRPASNAEELERLFGEKRLI
jgi:thioredoxin reductase (NADPH)